MKLFSSLYRAITLPGSGICILIGCKWREYVFGPASFLSCERCGRAIL